MKTSTVVLSIILAVVAVFFGVQNTQKASKAVAILDQERFSRMTAEEDLQVAQAKVSSLETEIKRAQGKLKSTETIMEQTKVMNEDLKARLDKAAQIKTRLEEKINELSQISGGVTTGF